MISSNQNQPKRSGYANTKEALAAGASPGWGLKPPPPFSKKNQRKNGGGEMEKIKNFNSFHKLLHKNFLKFRGPSPPEPPFQFYMLNLNISTHFNLIL